MSGSSETRTQAHARAPRGRRRAAGTRGLAVAALTTAAAGLTLVLLPHDGTTQSSPTRPALTASSTASEPSATATPLMTPEPGTSAAPTAAGGADSAPLASATAKVPDATDAAHEAVAQVAQALADPAQAQKAMGSLTGALREETLNRAQEMTAEGWHVEGVPSVQDAKIVQESADQVRLQACVDSSAVTVLDDAGNEVGATSPSRTLTLFTLVRSHGEWFVSEQAFAEDPHC